VLRMTEPAVRLACRWHAGGDWTRRGAGDDEAIEDGSVGVGW
jgi:hypothetical protein